MLQTKRNVATAGNGRNFVHPETIGQLVVAPRPSRHRLSQRIKNRTQSGLTVNDDGVRIFEWDGVVTGRRQRRNKNAGKLISNVKFRIDHFVRWCLSQIYAFLGVRLPAE